jgi:hypothetical protein
MALDISMQIPVVDLFWQAGGHISAVNANPLTAARQAVGSKEDDLEAKKEMSGSSRL